jgi:hypothetical protein
MESQFVEYGGSGAKTPKLLGETWRRVGTTDVKYHQNVVVYDNRNAFGLQLVGVERALYLSTYGPGAKTPTSG